MEHPNSRRALVLLAAGCHSGSTEPSRTDLRHESKQCSAPVIAARPKTQTIARGLHITRARLMAASAFATSQLNNSHSRGTRSSWYLSRTHSPRVTLAEPESGA